MKDNINGVSLLEILIVIAIFAVVSAGVTSLSVSMIQNQRDEATITTHTNIFNNIHDDIRRDLESATAVWLSNDESPVAIGSRNYVKIQDSIPTPIGAQNTLNILVQEPPPSGTPFSSYPTTQYFRFVRYQFNAIDSNPSLIRVVNNLVCANTADQLWPRNLNQTATPPTNVFVDPLGGTCGTVNYVGSMTPTVAAVQAAGGKVYNLSGDADEDSSITGNFTAQYTVGYSPPAEPPTWFVGACTTPPCSTYFLKSINLNSLTITATGYDSKYDKIFGGKAGEIHPTISFEINPSLKFF